MATGINILAFRELFLEIDKTCDNDFFALKIDELSSKVHSNSILKPIKLPQLLDLPAWFPKSLP